MERKIGEIFNYQDNWYQCIENTGYGCIICHFNTHNNIHCSDVFEIRGECLSCYRKDGKSVIFKKLKKVGEPEIINGKKVQSIVTGYVGCAFCIFKKGGACLSGGTGKNRDLMILLEKKEGWVNIYGEEKGRYCSNVIYSSKEEALNISKQSLNISKQSEEHITTIKIEWEE